MIILIIFVLLIQAECENSDPNIITGVASGRSYVFNASEKISKHIYQTYMTHKLPREVREYAKQWIEWNPDWEYHMYNDQDIFDFFKENKDQDYNDMVRAFPIPVMKADAWRYSMLHKTGGLFLDLDDKPIKPIKEWPGYPFDDIQVMISLEMDNQFCVWAILSAPNHPLIKFVADSIYDTYAKDGKKFRDDLPDKYSFVHYLTGPWAITRGIAEFLEYEYNPFNPVMAKMMVDDSYNPSHKTYQLCKKFKIVFKPVEYYKYEVMLHEFAHDAYKYREIPGYPSWNEDIDQFYRNPNQIRKWAFKQEEEDEYKFFNNWMDYFREMDRQSDCQNRDNENKKRECGEKDLEFLTKKLEFYTKGYYDLENEKNKPKTENNCLKYNENLQLQIKTLKESNERLNQALQIKTKETERLQLSLNINPGGNNGNNQLNEKNIRINQLEQIIQQKDVQIQQLGNNQQIQELNQKIQILEKQLNEKILRNQQLEQALIEKEQKSSSSQSSSSDQEKQNLQNQIQKNEESFKQEKGLAETNLQNSQLQLDLLENENRQLNLQIKTQNDYQMKAIGEFQNVQLKKLEEVKITFDEGSQIINQLNKKNYEQKQTIQKYEMLMDDLHKQLNSLTEEKDHIQKEENTQNQLLFNLEKEFSLGFQMKKHEIKNVQEILNLLIISTIICAICVLTALIFIVYIYIFFKTQKQQQQQQQKKEDNQKKSQQQQKQQIQTLSKNKGFMQIQNQKTEEDIDKLSSENRKKTNQQKNQFQDEDQEQVQFEEQEDDYQQEQQKQEEEEEEEEEEDEVEVENEQEEYEDEEDN